MLLKTARDSSIMYYQIERKEAVMAKNLVIVESPSKATTIKKFLGSSYEVVASNGHVRDLPKSQLGIDIENGFEPKYITIRGKGALLATLRKKVKKADKIYLATDPDREGEAISWHLSKALKLEDKNTSRITFNEITKNAVKQSIKNARTIDMDLVDAQQARRVLDRMVGYQISPVLWAKVKRGLSAGRVQSVALRIIADREEEINAFIPREYWTLSGEFTPEGDKKPVIADFYGTTSKKTSIDSESQMEEIIAGIKKSEFKVSDIKTSGRSKKPPMPFTTSTLQQEAAKTLNFSTQKTMRLAQGLYEGMEIKGHGTIGLITYLRTDYQRIFRNTIPLRLRLDLRRRTGRKAPSCIRSIRTDSVTEIPPTTWRTGNISTLTKASAGYGTGTGFRSPWMSVIFTEAILKASGISWIICRIWGWRCCT